MARVAVVTDSTAALPDELAQRHQVTVVPLYVVFGPDRTERETDITDYPAFFDELRGAESLPTTSQPSVGDFVAAYEPLLADGRDVVSVHISGGLSGTVESARQAAKRWSATARAASACGSSTPRRLAGGLGMVVLAAATGAPAARPSTRSRSRRGRRAAS